MPQHQARIPDHLGAWFHNIRLPDGTQTAPDHWLGDFPYYKWNAIAPVIPENLSGWTVLDVGCNGGFYSIELAKRGAEVLAIDIDQRYLAQARWAVGAFGFEDRVTVCEMEVYEVAHLARVFDLILFSGVFYHLRYPLLALDILAAHTRRMLVFQSMTLPQDEPFEPYDDYPFDQRGVMLHPGWPKMAFVEKAFANDPTNWWIPNPAAVRAMLRSSGFSIIHSPEHETYICEPAGPGHAEYQRHDYRELDAVFGIPRRRPEPAR